MFASPLVLLGLLALPGLYFLLRLTPPPARRVAFPPLALLRGLAAEERTPNRMPLWLLLLRLSAAGLVILGLAEPSLHPPPALPGNGPALLVIDNGWAAAADWQARRDTALRIISAAAQAGRGIAILPTARNAANSAPQVAGVMTADAARQVLAALQPEPWPADDDGAALALANAPPAMRIYIADGLSGPGFSHFMRILRPGRIFSDGVTARLLLPPVLAADGSMAVHMAAGPRQTHVLAETGNGAVLASAAVSANDDAIINLPNALSNRIARLVMDGPPSAGGTVMLDGSAHGGLIGLAAGEDAGSGDAETPYLGALFFARQALPFGTQAVTGGVKALIDDKVEVIILADVPLNGAPMQALQAWITAGGVLIRFAGPLTANAPDALTPDPLLAGERRLGGTLTWTAPQNIAPFPGDHVFAGLPADTNATVARQILADPEALNPGTVWASLPDGTPLVLGKPMGRGYLVSFLTTANADWSSLALSGLYPAMLARLIALSHGAPPKPDETLPALSLLGAYGDLTAATGTASITAAGLAHAAVSPVHPPGLYGSSATALALNLGGHVPPVVAADLPGAAALSGEVPPVDFGPRLIAAGLTLFVFDLLLSLSLRGLLQLPVLAILVLLATPFAPYRTQAQTAALTTTLAYVITGDAAADQTSADGLSYLSALVSSRSSALLGLPAGVTPGHDDLNLYPLLYWPVLPDAGSPSPAFCNAIISYMQHGGLLLIDMQGGDADAPGSGAGFAPGAEASFTRVTACLSLPPLEILTNANVLAHCFYIIQNFPGRFTGAPVLIATQAARDADGVTPVIIGQNDWAGAWARDAAGDTEQSPIPGGEDQRAAADRFGMNVVIYALTGSYKADQTSLPALLNRLGP